MRRRTRICLGASALFIGGLTPFLTSRLPAGADPSDRTVSIQFVGKTSYQASRFAELYKPDLSRCTTPGPCVTPVAAPAGETVTFTGSVQGTAKLEESSVLGTQNSTSPLDVPFTSYTRVVARVDRCGNGTFMLREDGNLNNLSTRWEIVPGSGTDRLGGITGSGTSTRAVGADGTISQTFTGSVICPNGDHQAGIVSATSVVTTTTTPSVPCSGAANNSGGEGVTSTVHNLGTTSGTFLISWDMFSVPDQLDVFYQGALLFTTGGPVRGVGSTSITYSGSSSNITVVITGPSGTAWNYTVNCPSSPS